MGPTVCELEGPIPILKMSKTLMFIVTRGTLAQRGAGVPPATLMWWSQEPVAGISIKIDDMR
jgi:hypothetical protein